jgi:NAD(P)-dependent dehydrogenase (short-subunit alcohol dehydrogenase family)
VTSYFLRLLGKEHPGTIIFLSSGLGLLTLPGSSGYSITKLSDLQLASYAAAENENVTAVAFHPRIVLTDMANDF